MSMTGLHFVIRKEMKYVQRNNDDILFRIRNQNSTGSKQFETLSVMILSPILHALMEFHKTLQPLLDTYTR